MGSNNIFLAAHCKSLKQVLGCYLQQFSCVKSSGLLLKQAAVVEVHPFIRSRMLRTQDLPEQLKQQLHKQIIHTFIRRDYENLFLWAVLADDYDMAASIMNMCQFTQRHDAIKAYYFCATRKYKLYKPFNQFNTFSAESKAKYGVVNEYENPFNA